MSRQDSSSIAEEIPTPTDIRLRLSRCIREAELLRRLLKLSERAEKVRVLNQREGNLSARLLPPTRGCRAARRESRRGVVLDSFGRTRGGRLQCSTRRPAAMADLRRGLGQIRRKAGINARAQDSTNSAAS